MAQRRGSAGFRLVSSACGGRRHAYTADGMTRDSADSRSPQNCAQVTPRCRDCPHSSSMISSAHDAVGGSS